MNQDKENGIGISLRKRRKKERKEKDILFKGNEKIHPLFHFHSLRKIECRRQNRTGAPKKFFFLFLSFFLFEQ